MDARWLSVLTNRIQRILDWLFCFLFVCSSPPINIRTCPANSLLEPPQELYCFPEYHDRVVYNNVWDGQYKVEVKESNELCGPGPNRFLRQNVVLTHNHQDHPPWLTLRFQYNTTSRQWTGSEVRVLRPHRDCYSYGSYDFSVHSIRVMDVRTNTIVSENQLPPSLVLGLFTWDDTDNYSIHENWNHEVDIEISQWNNPNDPNDAQFLVQPPGVPQLFRFTTANVTNETTTRTMTINPLQHQPGGHWYNITWNPGNIVWSTDAGWNGYTHTYSTQSAIQSGHGTDLVQCLPANMEVRMNLWNVNGVDAPIGLALHERVEVVLDDFRYTHSETKTIPNGSVCSKDCQCENKCDNGICT